MKKRSKEQSGKNDFTEPTKQHPTLPVSGN